MTITLEQIQDELRAAHAWRMAGEGKIAMEFVLSAICGITALFFPRIAGGREAQ
ncbi:MAG: hypothetical protein KAH44_06135 [Oricola sp.]|jgi:hypothetical protein|nr:hypothetical protein [Oricola sp.]